MKNVDWLLAGFTVEMVVQGSSHAWDSNVVKLVCVTKIFLEFLPDSSVCSAGVVWIQVLVLCV